MTIKACYIDNCVPMTDEIEYLISKLGLKPEPVDASNTVYEIINSAPDPVLKAKQLLFITQNKGAVIKKCPGTSVYTCCDYTILHTGTFCTMDCSYCILQTYFHPPVLQYFAGMQSIKTALSDVFSQKKLFRIGTGEYTDSLIWEPISRMPGFLVEQFSHQDNCILELKTKTVNIDSLLKLNHGQKTILAWSVNTPQVIQSQEKGTAALSARLKAAKKAQEKGYRLAFHFDPLIIYPDCEKEYEAVVKKIFTQISAKSIVWISLGTFRFMPPLKSIIEQRFPGSTICYGEFIQGLDNKMRYFKPLRIRLYQRLVSSIRKFAPDVLIYYCMEDEEVWRKTLGFFPDQPGELGRMLDKSAADKCGLNRGLLK